MPKTAYSATPKRPYHSPVRDHQAQATRKRILSVTRELFASSGYERTTVEAIAAGAGVSPKTVSAAFGSKRAILGEIVNPQAFGPQVQQLIEELRATPEPSKRLSLAPRIARQAYEPLVRELELLRTAPVVDAELAQLARETEDRRHQNQARLVSYLAQHGALRKGLEKEQATDVLWALTSYDTYRLLVVERHWSPEQYETWLTDLLVQQMLRPEYQPAAVPRKQHAEQKKRAK